ncbi:MAG: GT2 family glycosyltransferase [Gammaproteobacteria bacterium]|jgi:GT2 family glycosyltransferase
MNSVPNASLVVLSWNGMEHLKVCLSSVCAQTYQDREIILVDNGSNDGSKEWVETHYPEVRVERVEQNRGVPGGLNYGIARARGRFIAILNNDIEVDPKWLAESIQALEQHPEAGFTASRVRLYYQRNRLDTVGDLYFRAGYPAKRGWLQHDGPQFDEPVWVFSACAVAALYRRELFESVGEMDEDFEAGIEDLDLGFRAQLQGFKCRYVSTAIIYHKLGATVGVGLSNPAHQLRMHRNLWLLKIKNLPASLWLRYLPYMLLAEAAVLYRGLLGGHFSVLLKARLQVLRVLRKTLVKRRAIQSRRTVSVRELDASIGRNWIAHRIAEKKVEAEAASKASSV